MKYTASLKIKQQEVPAQVLMYLKKQTGDSLSVLKNKLSNNDFIITLSYCDLDTFRRINEIRSYLIDWGIDSDPYVNDRLEGSEYFKNLELRYREDAEEMRKQGFLV